MQYLYAIGIYKTYMKKIYSIKLFGSNLKTSEHAATDQDLLVIFTLQSWQVTIQAKDEDTKHIQKPL